VRKRSRRNESQRKNERHTEVAWPRDTEALIKRAIPEGLGPAGRPLDRIMPRWQLSNRDPDDLVDYLKTLD
jgi:cytochrome c oxidase subunit 2